MERVRSVVSDGVREIWLSSEDTGAYGNCVLVISEITISRLNELCD